MRVMVDLDGVCYDFGSALTRWLVMQGHSEALLDVPLESWYFYRTQWGMTDDEFVRHCAEAVDAGYLFAEGPVEWGAREGLQALIRAGHTVHLVTDRSFGHRSTENTERWLRLNQVPYTTLTFSGDKTIVDADIYLDDRPKNVDAITAAGKRAVIFHQRWNDGHPGERVSTWPEFVQLVEASKQTIIGVSGYARAGKDTVASALVRNHGFTRMGFADALKGLAYGMNPMVGRGRIPFRLAEIVDAEGWEEAKAIPEVRQLLQRLGTEGGRKVIPGLWVDALFKRAAGIQRLVISDVRFPDEAEAIRARGGEVWRVVRPGIVAANAHASETALDNFDFDRIVVNDGGLDELDRTVFGMVDEGVPACI